MEFRESGVLSFLMGNVGSREYLPPRWVSTPGAGLGCAHSQPLPLALRELASRVEGPKLSEVTFCGDCENQVASPRDCWVLDSTPPRGPDRISDQAFRGI